MQFHISKSRYIETSDVAKIEADVTLGDKRTTLYFSVPISDRLSLIRDRSDPFVVALLPSAMHLGHEIAFESPISERMAFKIETELSPMLSFVSDWYKPTKLIGPRTTFAPIGYGTATGFSGGVDSLYTVYTHHNHPLYPITEICVFNSGIYEFPRHTHMFERACLGAKRFSKEMNLATHFVNTNFSEFLNENTLNVYSFRNIACALALGGSISTYLLSSGHDAANASFDIHNAATYDLFNVDWLSTEYMRFYSSGSETTRLEKLRTLTTWPVSYAWLHPCGYGTSVDENCGECKKCSRDFLTLYALGALDKYGAVLNVNKFKSHIRQSAAFVLTKNGNHLYDELLDYLGVLDSRAFSDLSSRYSTMLKNLEACSHE